MSKTARQAAERAIQEVVTQAQAAETDHMTAGAAPAKSNYRRVTIAELIDTMSKLPVRVILNGDEARLRAEQAAIEQAKGAIALITALPHRQPSNGSSYTYKTRADNKVRTDSTGWWFRGLASATISWAAGEAGRADRDLITYRARRKAERDARSDTAAAIDGADELAQLAVLEARAIDSIMAAHFATILAMELTSWVAKVTDGTEPSGQVFDGYKVDTGAKKGTAPSGVLD